MGPRSNGMRLPPTPPPSSATKTMKANRSKDTGPELALRRALFARGMRYRIGVRITLPGRSVRPDIVFPRRKVAVFLDGCFWHGCPTHGRMPSDPTGYWGIKLARNKERDRSVDDAMRAAGWNVIRIWEHVQPEEAAQKVQDALIP